MAYHYLAFGIPVISEIELSALVPFTEGFNSENPVHVKIGTVPDELSGEAVKADFFTHCTPNELVYNIPEIMKLYIANGNEVIIEPVNPDYTAHLIYFYSACLTAILYQRNYVTFHVSGVFTAPGKVALFAAPSGTGKSTLAVKLQELGCQPFTDDTAVLYVENGKCWALASYPMMRLWEKTIAEQTLLKEDDKQKIYDDDQRTKYGFSFHQHFFSYPAEVQQIIFLKEDGKKIKINTVKNTEAFTLLHDNIFRYRWANAMQKNRLPFLLVGDILNKVPCQLAVRPKGVNSFEQFALSIKNIL